MTLTSPSTDQPDTPAPKGAHVLVISGSVSLYKEVTIAVAVDTRIQIVHVKSQLNGVTMFRRELPDVVILDVDGTDNQDWLVTVSRIRKIDRHAMIVMMSSKSIGHNASIYTDGLARGATDFLTVPASGDDAATKKAFRWKLNALVHALTIARRQVGPAPKREATRSPDRSAKLAYDTASITLRPRSLLKPTALAIASSTGGPRALLAVIAALPRDLGIPIFITQHMPSGFTTSLAKSISSKTNWECQEGVEGALALPGHIYLAPGGFHMEMEAGTPHTRIRITDTPPENFCKPSANPMIRSLIKIYGANLLLAVLTGMGTDALAGATQLAEAGGTVIAQDQETSVVWGMPGAVATNGLCSTVQPIDEIASEITRIVHGKA